MNRIALPMLLSCLALPAAAQDFETVYQSYRDRDHGAAYEGFTRLAKAGDTEAARWLGEMYMYGTGAGEGGPERSDADAVRAFEQAAQAGHSVAQWRLAFHYRHGRGVERDYAESYRWYRASAEQGLTISMNELGEQYLRGWGVEADEDEAYRWLLASAEAGDAQGADALARLYMNEGVGPYDDDERAAYWFRVSAEAGWMGGMRGLGDAYRRGRGVEQDRVEALRWYIKAEELPRSGDNMGTIMSLIGEMTPAEFQQAEAEFESWVNRE